MASYEKIGRAKFVVVISHFAALLDDMGRDGRQIVERDFNIDPGAMLRSKMSAQGATDIPASPLDYPVPHFRSRLPPGLTSAREGDELVVATSARLHPSKALVVGGLSAISSRIHQVLCINAACSRTQSEEIGRDIRILDRAGIPQSVSVRADGADALK